MFPSKSDDTASPQCAPSASPGPVHKIGSLEATYGGYTPHQGYLKVPDALVTGKVISDHGLPWSVLPVILTAHKIISISGHPWISKNDILAKRDFDQSTVKRALLECLRVGLVTKRKQGNHIEYHFDGMYRYLKKAHLSLLPVTSQNETHKLNTLNSKGFSLKGGNLTLFHGEEGQSGGIKMKPGPRIKIMPY